MVQFNRHIAPEIGTDVPVYIGGGDGVALKKIRVKRNSFLDGKTIRESAIREKTKGLVVGIERNNKRMLNPESNLILKEDDLIWIVGDAKKIEEVKQMQVAAVKES